MRLAHPGALHDPPLSENMATSVDSGQRYEHVERLEPQGPPNNVEAAQERLEPPAPRRTTRPSSSGRPRPVSMPPVAATEPINGPLASDQPEQRSQPHSSSRRGTSRATVRVIGNYSLGKTLGAGSMGKVKLAYHNQTGEKVCSLRRASNSSLTAPRSSLSKLFQGPVAPIRTLETLLLPSWLARPPRMRARRLGPSEKRPCR